MWRYGGSVWSVLGVLGVKSLDHSKVAIWAAPWPNIPLNPPEITYIPPKIPLYFPFHP